MVTIAMDHKQYEIWVFDPEPSIGHEVKKVRPCVIISPDDLNAFLATVIIAPLTSKVRNYPFRPGIKLGKVSGSIMLDQMRCVDKKRLTRKISVLQLISIIKVKEIIKEMLVD
jgi:mRNA interferase MazF